MPLPPEKARRYLLGELSATEEQEIDERLLGDEETLAALEIAEDELYDAGARGELSHAERRALQQRFGGARARVRRIVAGGLAARARDRKLLPRPRRAFWLAGAVAATAAVVALLVAAPWKRPPPEVAIVELAPPTRGEPASGLAIPAGAQTLELRPELEGAAAGVRYRLTLSAGGTAVAGPVETAAPVLDVPAEVLAAGTYDLLVERAAGGGFEAVGHYPLRILAH